MTKVTNMMKLAFAAFLSIVMLPAMSQNNIAMQASTLGTDIVSKDIGDPSANPWIVGQWVTVGGEVKFACIDGPDFDAHKIDFDEVINRSKIYKEEERKRSENCNLLKQAETV